MDTFISGRRLSLRFLILAGLVLGCISLISAADAYDFIQKASKARWSRNDAASGKLPFGGQNTDARGFVRSVTNAVLEDGKTYARVLETHPEWRDRGIILGVYENIAIPADAKFFARVGFLQGADRSDGVTFSVIVLPVSGARARIIARKKIFYEGHLDDLSTDLSAYAGESVAIRLQVDAGSTSTEDRAVWVSATVTQPLGLQGTADIKPRAPLNVAKSQSGLANIQKFRPSIIDRVPLLPVGTAPAKHKIEDVGPLSIEEPLTLLNRIYKDNEKPNTYYYLPREINLIREPATGDYRVSAVWTQDQKIRTTLTLQANIDPADVKIMEEGVRAAKGLSAVLKSMPYDEANIIDVKGWEDWKIEDIRIPTFGSLETELPISIAMTPETLAQLKPLLEKEGLTAGMRIKTGEVEREIPIKVGLKYFTGRWYSPLEELSFSYDMRGSLLTLHDVRNLSDFPLKIAKVSLRFRFADQEEVYKNLRCQPEVTIPPGESRNVQAQLVLRDRLLAEYRKAFPEAVAPPPAQKKNPLLAKALEILKDKLDKKGDKEPAPPAEVSGPADPKMDALFKTYARSYWLEAAPDFECQTCLDKIWNSIEVVSYIERMRKINVEALTNVFDPSAYETPLEVEKLHIEIRSPYLSAQSKEGLLAAVDLSKEKLKDLVVVYLPLATQEKLSFEYKIKAVLKTGEAAESVDWEKVVDSLDLTLGIFHVKKIFQK
jgi:hypothetical protein